MFVYEGANAKQIRAAYERWAARDRQFAQSYLLHCTQRRLDRCCHGKREGDRGARMVA